MTLAEAGNYELASYEYGESNGKLEKITYSTGLVVEYSYNPLENLEKVWYTKNGTRTLAYEYEYTADGKLHTLKNNLSGRTLLYKYDINGKLVTYREYTNDALDFTYASDYAYNDQGNLRTVYQKLNYRLSSGYAKSNVSYTYTYDTQGRLTQLKLGYNASGTLNYSYDRFGKLTGKNFTAGSFTNNSSYTYSTSSKKISPTQIKTHSYTLNGTTITHTYTYDCNGNITKDAYSTGQEIRYVYDDLNQLIREDNGIRSETYVYTYDNAGNITSKKTYNLTAATTTPSSPKSTKTYTYGDSTWGDRLTKYNGTTITYDSIGNPLSYYNGISYSFSWTGRQLAGATAGGYTYTFTYGDDGVRTSKVKSGAKTVYYYDGSKLVAEERSNATFIYLYDAEGSPIGFRARNHTYASGTWDVYWYEKNLQGDVISVYNNAGTKLVSYKYDAWGNFSKTSHNSGSSTLAWQNPITYRGYYYDSDISLYTLGTRYYDPATGRFLNADSYVSTGQGILGNNMYAYCNNNPVNYIDPAGEFAISAILIVTIAGIIVGSTVGGIIGNDRANREGCTGWNRTKYVLNGIGIGGFAGGALGYFVAPTIIGATGVAGISVTYSGISTITALGTSFGNLGTLIANNGQQIIDWSKTTWHGMQRMIERGVTQEMVEVWVKNGKALQQAGDKILYITKQGAVVIDKAGAVITAYTNQYFDPAMQEVVEKLFGK